MKRFFAAIIISILTVTSCMTLLGIDPEADKKRLENLSKIQTSYFKYSEKATIYTIMRTVSDKNYVEWAGGTDGASCRIYISYPDPQSYAARMMVLGIFLKFDETKHESVVESIWDMQSGEWYREPIGIDYVMNTIMIVYKRKISG